MFWKLLGLSDWLLRGFNAEGGQAVWDCTTLDGQKVLPGIYLVFVSTPQGEQRYATKILIMN